MILAGVVLMILSSVFGLLKDTYSAWSEDRAPRLGAALAYYTIFSIAPLLIVAVGIAGQIFGEEAARGEVMSQVEETVGGPAAATIQDMLRHSYTSGTSIWATVVGLAVLLFGASGVFVQLQDALNTIWRVAPRPDRGWLEVVRDRFLSFGAVLATGLLLLVSLAANTALAALGKFLAPDALPGGLSLWQGLNALVSLAFFTLLFALLFKLLPDVYLAWRDVWIGALVTAVLFTIGNYLIGLYLGYTSTASAFGAAGSLVVLLVWVYYSAQILLFGAEFTYVLACRRGTCIEPKANAVAVTEEARARQGMPSRRAVQVAAHASSPTR
jgi:membrane protein